jgi:tRNA(Ile)-lysidine synthase
MAVDHDPVLERLRREGLVRSGTPVLVLISGGRDSTCLLHVCVQVVGAEAVTALHVNDGLREGAAGDPRCCVELCGALGVKLELRRPPGPPRGNTQAWARAQRYEAAAALAERAGAVIVTGHTADDQLETILYRMISSPSRRAVLGMRQRGGRVVRPLLALSRAQTTAYCERHGLHWREDQSNDSDAYVRNRIRRQLLPLLRELHPAAEANLLRLAARLREEGEVLDALVAETLSGEASIELARLRALKPALARLVVQRLADDALGAPAAGVAARFGELAALGGHGTSTLDIGCGLRAVSEYGVLRIEPRRGPDPVPEPVTLPVPGEAGFGETLVRCELVAPAREPGVLDRDALSAELIIRGWRHGDRMRPLGLKGSKSLQDLFTARRVPRERRATVAVVESGGEIVWVDGVATAERYKVSDATRAAVRLSARRQYTEPQ